jgi:cellobiose phosphorylase
MYLEPQAFLLQTTDFPVGRKQVLLREIRRRLLAGEVEGPRQRETPLKSDMMQGGTGENGGFWWALSGPLVLGVATFDQAAASDLLRQMTFANFTRHYPGYWVGQWTAPDTLNASTSGAIAGLPRPGGWGDGQNWSSFGAYCAHAHAWPLYCYYRLGELRSQ